MNLALSDFVKKTIKENGFEILNDSEFIEQQLTLVPSITKTDRRVFIKVLLYDFHNVLYKIPKNKRSLCSEWFCEKLYNEEGIEQNLCKNIIDVLRTALLNDTIDTSFEIKKPNPVKSIKSFKQIKVPKAEKTCVIDLKKIFDENMHKSNIAIVFLGIALFISICVGSAVYKSQKDALQKLNAAYGQIQHEYDHLFENWIIQIDSIEVGNSDKNNKWISQPGNSLKSPAMRLFNPVIKYTALVNDNVKFDIKIFDPIERLKQDEKSEDGYTFSRTKWVTSGSNLRTLDLDGWGDIGKSIFESGKWTVEIWHKGVFLKSYKVDITN